MRTPNELQKLFSNVKTRQEALDIWNNNTEEINNLIQNHTNGKGWKAFMRHHIPWVIERNKNVK